MSATNAWHFPRSKFRFAPPETVQHKALFFEGKVYRTEAKICTLSGSITETTTWNHILLGIKWKVVGFLMIFIKKLWPFSIDFTNRHKFYASLDRSKYDKCKYFLWRHQIFAVGDKIIVRDRSFDIKVQPISKGYSLFSTACHTTWCSLDEVKLLFHYIHEFSLKCYLSC